MFSNDPELFNKIYYSHNFGHKGPLDFQGLGINAKISELQAAMGLAVFPHIDKISAARKEVCDFYDNHLDFSKIRTIRIREHTGWNYSYYPVIFADEATLLK